MEWENNVDQLIILMSLCIARVYMKQWPVAKRRIGSIITARLDNLIAHYGKPHAHQ